MLINMRSLCVLIFYVFLVIKNSHVVLWLEQSITCVSVVSSVALSVMRYLLWIPLILLNGGWLIFSANKNVWPKRFVIYPFVLVLKGKLKVKRYNYNWNQYDWMWHTSFICRLKLKVCPHQPTFQVILHKKLAIVCYV